MRIDQLDTVDSTNEEVKRRLAEEPTGRVAVVAREQTAGRGTRGRSWASPRDAGIYLSVGECAPAGAPAEAELYTMAAGAECAASLEALLSTPIRIKPVNDLLADGRKLAGILTESTVRGGDFETIVIGIGVNVWHATRPVAPGAIAPVCLEEVVGAERLRAVTAEVIVGALVGALGRAIDLVGLGEEARIRSLWAAHLSPPGSG